VATDPTPEAAAPRIGIFGGTFDPPHVGHVSVARDVADALRLDRVVWMPAGRPPHKERDRHAPAEDRLAMVRAAVAGEDGFEVDAREVERPGPSYTVDSVRELRAELPAAELFVIVGADQFRSFGGWRDPEGILEHARLVVMNRPGESEPPVDTDPRVLRVPVRQIDVSSTDVRERVCAGADPSPMVPDGVLEIIEERGLYRGA
jgi:nicotinate-nucleotide adenylyltransferase